MTSSLSQNTAGGSRIKALLSQLPKLVLADSSSTFDKFTYFQHLPTELRNKIWAYAAYEPRSVRIKHPLGEYEQTHSPIHQRTVPSILHTCLESRHEGLRHYEYCVEGNMLARKNYEEKSLANRHSLPDLKKLYINFEVDRFIPPSCICFCKLNAQSLNFAKDIIEKVRFLDLRVNRVERDQSSCIIRYLERVVPGLKTILKVKLQLTYSLVASESFESPLEKVLWAENSEDRNLERLEEESKVSFKNSERLENYRTKIAIERNFIDDLGDLRPSRAA